MKRTGVCESVDEELKAVVLGTKAKVAAKMEELRVADAITEIFTLLNAAINILMKLCHGLWQKMKQERPSGRSPV